MKKQYSLIFFSWLGVCILGALPYYFSGYFYSFTDAFFESVSGFTTTGASVLTNTGGFQGQALPSWLLFWRSAAQWLGGIMTMFTFFIVPVYTTGGFQLKRIEAADLSGLKIILRFSGFIVKLILIYVSLTALQFLLLLIFGADWSGALTQSFSTVSTGGFSVHKNGVSFYNSAPVEWVHIIFMFLSGLNITLIWLLLMRKTKTVFKNSEARAYAVITLAASAVVSIAVISQSHSAGTALRQSVFNVVSLISTTGALTGDVRSWPYAAQGVLFFLLFAGGCSFSAAGGVKIIRYVMLGKQTLNEMRRLVFPRGVFIIRLDGKRANKRMVHGAAGFVFLYFLILALTTLLVSSCGTELFASVITAAACQGNIGLGALIPYHGFPAYVKWGLCFVMLAGRLELWIAFALVKRSFWRR